MSNTYDLVIPSRERAKWLISRGNKVTLPNVDHLLPRFYVREDDSQRKEYAEYVGRSGAELTVYDGSGIYGAAQTYDYLIDKYIMEMGRTSSHNVLIILDDDLTFAMRNPIEDAKPMYRVCTPTELAILLQHAADLVCPQMPLMTFTPIMSRTQQDIIAYCKPIMMAYVIYLPHFEKHPFHRFWKGKEIEARCDLNLSLTLLTEGYLTSFMNSLFIPDNVNNPGGCSTYRDLECEKASVKFLKGHYPSYVKTHKKLGWAGDPNVIREAPVISWKKAFNAAAFWTNFNEHPSFFAQRWSDTYRERYKSFVEKLRAEAQRK
jgi:hypothetical protein